MLFELKMKFQRFCKGYCDLDVWNINTFIEKTLLEIFKKFKEKHIGHPFDTTEEE